ncbi:MAG: CBS domain-containing protein [Armatimonadetes bacterium CG_4_10_14_3_um_filter_66_18]|nr:CBS domain-containing protein [Armatimonadota bacterium]PIU88834.1 MAG: CBS domain-containing protein [Armatimonadetes bacterium CG06_land_8_20_14_3_00_66_21]PIX49213.1 MAG: CBS domain-containing protein [Armatimonadetes bacterium CG_4_8_14_3_um_filter_66_20]PIY52790.1 MAG: CBS domain-containing protein [Armatimonadetes bacterium CG_4_10_14_3_um_filter_66_18]PIZ34472.1 MAG: CBS domain-containing protein [Armatimonadetes bacterium CG_4_10_14_0_8_um_filter_66_14]
METKRAEEFMIPLSDYPHIPYWFTLRQAIAEMENSQIEVDGRKSLPRVVLVFNEAYELLGAARRRDILRGLEPRFLVSKSLDYRAKLFDVKVDPNLSELPAERVIKGLREQAERPISDVMIPIGATVSSDDHLMKVIYEMVANDLCLIPVMQEGKVAGVVRSVDALHEVAQLVL